MPPSAPIVVALTAQKHIDVGAGCGGQRRADGAVQPRLQRRGRRWPTPPAPRGGGAGAGAAVAGGGRRGGGPPPAPARETWYAEPQKVFDNLYFVGQTEFSAWAITTSQGIILLDAIYDYSVEAEVDEGLRKLGLNPADIKYVDRQPRPSRSRRRREATCRRSTARG